MIHLSLGLGTWVFVMAAIVFSTALDSVSLLLYPLLYALPINHRYSRMYVPILSAREVMPMRKEEIILEILQVSGRA